MSATNRGIKRREYDFYATPIEVVNNFLLNYKLPAGDILEPSAGNGNIIKAIKEYGYKNNITAIEIREEELNNLDLIADEVIIDNFLELDINRTYDIIIGNPPYKYAKEFIEKCLSISNNNTIIIMLLRTAFLESKSRYKFWQDNPLSELHVLSKRPSFTGKGTDATSYSWFIWDKRTNIQKIKII